MAGLIIAVGSQWVFFPMVALIYLTGVSVGWSTAPKSPKPSQPQEPTL
jgi:hypothetical protein